MFTVIEPKDHPFHPIFLSSVKELISSHSIFKKSFQDIANATVIVFMDESKRFYGGAVLLKQKASLLHKGIQKSINTFASKKKEIWICTLFLREEHNCFSRHFEFFFETFYRNLYKKLVEFGTKEKTDFLYMMLEPGEYLCTEVMGCWPYVFEVKPHESMSGLFHGVLSFKIKLPKIQVENRTTKFPIESHLAA